MNIKQLEHLCRHAIQAAKTAGEIIANFPRQKIHISMKEGGDSYGSQIFTEVDLASQNAILEILNPTIKKYDLGLLTEEENDGKSRLTKEFFWCIDPLDGTLPFTRNLSGYSVSIALISKAGKPQIGVVCDPITGNLYHAFKGGGAFKNGKPLELKRNRKTFNFYTDNSFTKFDCFDKVVEGLKSMLSEEGFGRVNQLVQAGAVMNAIWTIENAPACYFKFPKPTAGGGSIWDYAATNCIFNELKLPATNILGKPLNLNRPETTFMNQDGALYTSEPKLAEKITKLFSELTSR